MMTCDFHVDVPWQLHKHGYYNLTQYQPDVAVDYPRMREGGLRSAFFALYLSDAEQDRLGDFESTEAIWKQVTHLKTNLSPDVEVRFGLEGGRLLHGRQQQLEAYANIAKIEYLTLVHNFANNICDSATDKSIIHDGLSEWGVAVVVECENLGVLVDLSHASDAAAYDVLDISNRPVVATHSGCRVLVDHPRNLPDDLIWRIVLSDGVIGVPFARRFVGNSWKNVGDHIDHICQLVGDCRHVGIGSDLDGAVMAGSIEDVSQWMDVVDLSGRGYTDEQIEDIRGTNILRLMNARSK